MARTRDIARVVGAMVADGHLAFVSRLAVGAVLLLAGVTKAPHRGEFVDLVTQFGILPTSLSEAYGLVLPWAEIATGVCLILGVFTRYAAALSILLLASFTVANGVSLARGTVVCGECFGKFAELLAWQALGLDIVFLLMSAQILLRDKQFLSLDSLLTRRAAAPPRRRRS